MTQTRYAPSAFLIAPAIFLRQHLHLLFRLSFDHHPRQRFCPRIAHHNAPVAVQFALGIVDGLLDLRHLGERHFLAHPHVLNHLRKNFQIADQFRQRLPGPRHGFHHAQRGQQTVAGGGFAVAKNDVAGLLSAQHRATLLHLLQHVLVAHIGAQACECRNCAARFPVPCSTSWWRLPYPRAVLR